MNENIQKIAEKYKEQFCNDDGCIDVIAYDTIDQLVSEIVEVCSEVIIKSGYVPDVITGLRKPRTLRQIAKIVKTHFGVE